MVFRLQRKISDLFKLELSIVGTGEASADVQQVHLEAQFVLGGEVKAADSFARLGVGVGVRRGDGDLRLTPISNTQRASAMAWV